ncbi:hypothetical protein RchiOBHm_Chr0c30g0501221 [Rosa chinensis]|uniref:Uncharacterized protein n=1 Tax=Rosa chinensis TaxID=74649 RepID=A0A2P6SQA4_ROSCH|nr:hypothetical protein RchiOBHm_Chr0c30g0501221 [Rosa chinensis]
MSSLCFFVKIFREAWPGYSQSKRASVVVNDMRIGKKREWFGHPGGIFLFDILFLTQVDMSLGVSLLHLMP